MLLAPVVVKKSTEVTPAGKLLFKVARMVKLTGPALVKVPVLLDAVAFPAASNATTETV